VEPNKNLIESKKYKILKGKFHENQRKRKTTSHINVNITFIGNYLKTLNIIAKSKNSN
jgi:hypothetical protein